MKLIIFGFLLLQLLQDKVNCLQHFSGWTGKYAQLSADFVGSNKFTASNASSGYPVTTPTLIAGKGYPIEIHEVITEDGYILEVHRIPHKPPSKQSTTRVSRIPVLVIHGGLAASADWVINPETEDCFGFYLADRGYDVWLGNIRGNDYARRHLSLDPSDSRFWEYSQHEIGIYDIAATIDHILNVTGKPKVFYTGVSLAGGSLIVLLSKKPEYNQKVGIASLMAPGAVYMDHSFNGGIHFVAPIFLPIMNLVSRIFGDRPILPYYITNFLHHVLPVVCNPTIDRFGVCLKILVLIYGDDFGLIPKDKIPLITSIVPSPVSTRVIQHIFQTVASSRFAEFDYGTSRNLEIYGRPDPPAYNLINVQVPISIIVGKNDRFVTLPDARKLATNLPNVVDFYVLENRFFHHIDFSYATGIGKLAYKKL